MSFGCIHTEAGLIRADLCQEIAAGEARGQSLTDFGLSRGARLTDKIAAGRLITGDDQGLTRGLRKHNKQEREGKLDLLTLAEHPDVSRLAETPDDTVEAVRRKDETYAQTRARGAAWRYLWMCGSGWIIEDANR